MLLRLRPRIIVPTPVPSPNPGPDGTGIPAKMGAPNRAATITVADRAALLTKLASGTVVSGDVIEVTSADLRNGTSSVTLPEAPGASGWAQQVLVRPPLGQFGQMYRPIVDCSNLIVAGFEFVNQSTAREQAAAARKPFAGFWRCLDRSHGVQWQLDRAGDDSVLCEVVAPYPWYGSGEAKNDAGTNQGSTDFIHFLPASGTDQHIHRPTMDGCYFNSRLRGCKGQRGSGGTAGSTPAPLCHLAVTGALTAGDDVATFTVDAAYTATHIGCNVTTAPTVAPTQVRVRATRSGVELWSRTIVLDATPDWLWRMNDGLSLAALQAGDIVHLDVLADNGAVGLDVWVGVTSLSHTDILQLFSTSGTSFIHDPTVRDTVLGSAASSVIQFANATGVVTYDHNWFGSGGIYVGHQGDTLALAGCEFHVTDNFIDGTIYAGNATLAEFTGNLAVTITNGRDSSGLGSQIYPYDGTNVSGVAPVAIPPLLNLATIWPEHPVTL